MEILKTPMYDYAGSDLKFKLQLWGESPFVQTENTYMYMYV